MDASEMEANKTRQKLENTPFKSATEMNQASHDIQMQVWKRLEYARVFQQMTDNENYRFVKDELEQGLTCGYGEEGTYLVRVYSEGVGVKISINKDLVKEVEKSEGFVEALIRSTSDSFSKSYYQIKGMLPIDSADVQDMTKAKQR
ncbi:MAG: hypothetical protein BroJett040_01240 [Oligoflexia bacterium]|nr:MAG: hypothetical protein BroJett040_01240 [Oligoflexia bacterium]